MNERYRQTRKATLVGAIANIFLAISKVIIGFMGHSSALVADGVHSFSDLLTDLLVILAAKFAHQKADTDHPYGHDRIETAATVGLAAFLVIVGGLIVLDGIKEVFTKQYGDIPHAYVLWVALLSVLINEAVYFYTKKIAEKINSDILRANALHSRSDSASSLVVLIGVAGTLWGIVWLDALAAIIVGVMIVKMGAMMAWKNLAELVDEGVEPETLANIKETILSVMGVVAIHQLRTRKMAGKILLDVHIIVAPTITVSEGHHIGDQVLTALYRQVNNLYDVTVHIDSEDDENFSETAKLPTRAQLLPRLKEAWKNLPAGNHIININLHYLGGKMTVDITLASSSLGTINLADLATTYHEAIKNEVFIDKINILVSHG